MLLAATILTRNILVPTLPLPTAGAMALGQPGRWPVRLALTPWARVRWFGPVSELCTGPWGMGPGRYFLGPGPCRDGLWAFSNYLATQFIEILCRPGLGPCRRPGSRYNHGPGDGGAAKRSLLPEEACVGRWGRAWGEGG